MGPGDPTEGLTSDRTSILLNEIRDLADRGFYTDALEAALKPELAGTLEGKRWQGILLLALERNREAVAAFRKCVFLQPEEAEYRRWLSVALESSGRTSEAQREIRNATELDEP
jgi:Flp pilus assembly protein TadD